MTCSKPDRKASNHHRIDNFIMNAFTKSKSAIVIDKNKSKSAYTQYIDPIRN